MAESIVELLTRQNKALRERVSELEETIIQLREANGGPVSYLPTWLPHLTPMQERLMIALRDTRQRITSRDVLFDAICGRRESEPPDPKIIDVQICKLRRIFADTPVKITTHWGRGYSISDEAKDLLAGVSAPLTVGVAS